MYLSSGILFKYENKVRSLEFVTRKLSMVVAKIAKGSKDPVILGNLSAVKDWSYARDCVNGMWKILQQDYPDDFVLGTNESYTVREFVEAAFRTIGRNMTWKGSGVNEVGLLEDGETLVKVSREFFRPLKSDNYRGDYSKARKTIGWELGTKLGAFVKIMVESDIRKLEVNQP